MYRLSWILFKPNPGISKISPGIITRTQRTKYIMHQIPVIDLFAGPGGLAEGFSSVVQNNKRVFKIKLSIEKDEEAHKTLLLRSFCRQFPPGKLPDEYYRAIEAKNTLERERLVEALFEAFPVETEKAKAEAWLCELGSDKFPASEVDKRIANQLDGAKNWVLIGGPPCQAYSLAGRSRVGGIDPEDIRVFLYKEYLRIIAHHHPSAFVMENVKGLLSAEVNGEKVFDWIKRDLQNPQSVFPESNPVRYRIYSLSTEATDHDDNNNPIYKNDSDYLIRSEEYGIPQKRHRVILLGIRDDIQIKPQILSKSNGEQILENIIGQLPKLRSGVSRKFIKSEIILKDGKKKKKRIYEPVENSNKQWAEIYKRNQSELNQWAEFPISTASKSNRETLSTGAEFVECNDTLDPSNNLYDWYSDPRLKGVPNHETRTHLQQDLKRYLFATMYTKHFKTFPRMADYARHSKALLPDHENATSGKFADRFRVQVPHQAATTVTSHIAKDGHYFIHYDAEQCRSLTVREAARIQTFPDNYIFCGSRTSQYHQVGNAVPPYLAYQIAKIVKPLLE